MSLFRAKASPPVELAEELTIELAALNTAVSRALIGAAVALEQAGVPREAFVEKLLLPGKDVIDLPRHLNIPEDRRAAIVERARSRYIEIIDAAYRATPRL